MSDEELAQIKKEREDVTFLLLMLQLALREYL